MSTKKIRLARPLCTSIIVIITSLFSFLSKGQSQWNNITPDNSPVRDVEALKDIAVDPVTNDVWIAAENIVYRRKVDGTWTVFEVGVNAGLSSTGCIAARNGIVWAGPQSNTVNKLSYFDGQWHEVIVPNATFTYVLDIEIAENFVWVATERGVYQYNGQQWRHISYHGGVEQPTSVSWDAQTQKLWVAYNCLGDNRNALKYNPADDSWTEYQLGQSGCAHTVQALPGGDAYVGSCNYSSVLSIKNGVVSPDIRTECMAIDGVALNPLADGEAWFITDQRFNLSAEVPWGLIRYNGNTVPEVFNFTNSPMKGGGGDGLAVQKIDENSAVVWMITYKYAQGQGNTSFLETYSYTQTAPKNIFTSFGFLNQDAIGEIDGDQIYVDLPDNPDISQLIATFTVPEGAVVKIGNVVQQSGVMVNDFNHPVYYSVTGSDGSVKDYEVIVSLITGTEEDGENGIEVYPVPARDYFTVRLPERPRAQSLRLTLYSVYGQVLEIREAGYYEKEVTFRSANVHGPMVILHVDGKSYKVVLDKE